MKTNPLKEGALTENSAGIGTVTGKMVRERGVELAISNVRSARDVSKSDWEPAKGELTGEPDTDPNGQRLNQRPNPNAGIRCMARPDTKCQEIPVTMRTPKGRSDIERLVEEDIAGADHDQMLQASLE